MYRKRNGSLGFSFTRFANIVVPNFFADTSPSTASALAGLRKDMCYAHQLSSPNPVVLDERSFYVAGVADSEAAFIHQLASINVVRQRELINMLFWWEEETQRLKKLIAEEKELDGMIDAAEELFFTQQQPQDESDRENAHDVGNNDVGTKEKLDQLKFARERIRMKMRQRPSQRRADVEADKDDLMDAFYGRRNSAPLTQSPGMQDCGKPPEYYAPG
ncbi:hypothetical protein DV737_g4510, partial [Chaetothyriales sp. CBS 132003]